MADQEDVVGYTVCVYAHPGRAPLRTEFPNLMRAEKAFQGAKGAAILFQTRPPSHGLGWIKLKEKSAPAS